MKSLVIACILFLAGCATDNQAANNRGCYSETAHSWCKGASK